MTETIENVQLQANRNEPLLSVRDLRVTFQRQGEKPFVAVDGISFDVRPGETVVTMGAGVVMALVGFHKVTVSPQVGRKTVGANVSVKG